jgi:hypothetical protein
MLRSIIIGRLREWHDGSPLSDVPWDCTFREAVLDQDTIGWYPFLLGQVSIHWKSVQHAYYQSLGLDNTGKQWVRLLILQLFNISWDMWEHRNGIKHKTLTPAKRRAIQLLDQRIYSEFATGSRHLLPRDKRWLRGSAHDLVAKLDTVQKSQWLASVANARQMLWLVTKGGNNSVRQRLYAGESCGKTSFRATMLGS